MKNFTFKRRLLMSAPLALAAFGLTACDGDDDDDIVMPTPSPTPAPTPPPTGGSDTFDVSSCLQQEVAPGTTVADLIVPDTLTLSLAGASGFPNGRRLPDQVIDVTLAVIFLDLGVHSPTTLAQLPLNPPSNDKAFRSGFPFLATPQGSPPVTTATSSSFDFRTDGVSNYVRVDRMGMPAVSTALIGSDTKTAYNDASPAEDIKGTFVPELASQLTGLTNALADDLVGAGLTPCATPE